MPHPREKTGLGLHGKFVIMYVKRLFVDLKIAYSKSSSVIQKMRTKILSAKIITVKMYVGYQFKLRTPLIAIAI